MHGTMNIKKKLKQLLGLGGTRHTLLLSLSTGVLNLGTTEQLKPNSFVNIVLFYCQLLFATLKLKTLYP